MFKPAHSRRGLLTAFCLGALAMAGVTFGETLAKPSPGDDAVLATADRPGEGAAQRWRDIAAATVREFNQDRIPAVAAGVTFFFLLALFPAISAFVSLYGLIASPSDAQGQIAALAQLLPGGALSVVSAELTRLIQTDHGALGLAFALSLVLSIWSASSGVKALIDGLNVAYEAHETRGFVALTLLSVGLTVAAIGVAVAGVAIAAAASSGAGELAGWVRWPLLLILSLAGISAVYRLGARRPAAGWRWITPGSVIAAIAWFAMSGLFTWYVANFGHYDETYGSLGAIVGFLTWIWLSLMVLLLGAELNHEIEKRPA